MRRVNNNQRRRLRQNIEVRPLMRRIISNMLFDCWYFCVSPGFPKVRKIIRFCAGASMGMGFIAAAVFLFFGTEAGHLEAKFDLWRHHYEIRTYTSDRSHVAAYRELLKTYGITYRRVSISAFNPFTTNHFEAYNRTMKKGIRSQLDLDVESLFRFFQILEMIESDSDTKTWTSPAAFFEEIAPIIQDRRRPEADWPHIIMDTQKPGAGSSDHFRLSKCHAQVQVDLDGDSFNEKICIRELRFKEWYRQFMKRSVVVDVSKNRQLVLRQEFALGAFWREKYLKMIDVDADGRKGLVTTVKFGPQCAGCLAHRIYAFEQDRFEPILHLFGVDPENSFVRRASKELLGIEAQLQGIYRSQTGLKYPCGYFDDCVQSPTWLMDPDGDGKPEIFLLAMQPYTSSDEVGRFINIVIGKVSGHGELEDIKLYPTAINCCEGLVDLLGFLRTRDGSIHVLVNHAYAGTSSAYPVLHVFDIGPASVKPIGQFAGFYEPVIAERLRDLDKDGDTEIIYVKEIYWPSGESQADVILFYGVAKFNGRRYTEITKAMPD